MSNAARITDDHKCPAVEPGPKPHVGGPILPPATPTIRAGSLPMARVGDKAMCVGPPDFLVTGSASVRINGKAATRLGDKTMHGGVITKGCSNVRIGGPAKGGTLGNPIAGKKAFAIAAQGRVSGAPQQSYQNCGVESARQIINQATGRSISEDVLLKKAMDNDWATRKPLEEGGLSQSGGTGPDGRKEILMAGGVNSQLQPQTMKNIEQAAAEGKGVITSNNAGLLWNDPRYRRGNHAVVVTGIEYGADGKPTTVFINDTGTGIGKDAIPAERFESSLNLDRKINVTSSPIW